MRDRSARRPVRDSGLGRRGHRDLHSDAGGLLRLGCEKREEFGLGADQIRPHGGRAGDRGWTLHQLQHESREVVRAGIMEQPVDASLDLLVRSDRRRPHFLVYVQNYFRRSRQGRGRGACTRSCRA